MRVRWGMAARPVTLINGNTCVIATSFDADYGKQHNVMAIHKDDGRAGHSISDDALCPSCKSNEKKISPAARTTFRNRTAKFRNKHHQHSASAPALD
jgi:hypothetical protein